MQPTPLAHICQAIYNASRNAEKEQTFLRWISSFRALADPTRLRLLNLIADKEICVCFFVEILGSASPRFRAIFPISGAPASRRPGARDAGCITAWSSRRTLWLHPS